MGALTKYLINNKIFPTPDNVIKIKPTHIFVDELARNAYFILNPSERVEGVLISVGVGFQQWLDSVWEDKTAVAQGTQGVQGTQGIQGIQGLQGIQGISGTVIGVTKEIKIPITTTAETLSTTEIPLNAIVTEINTNISTAYSALTTITTYINGSVPVLVQTVPNTFTILTGGNNSFISNPNIQIGATGTGVVKVNVNNTPIVGEGYVIVKYIETFYS